MAAVDKSIYEKLTLSSVNEINQASADFQNAENFGLPEPPGFDLDNEQEQASKE